MKLGKTALLEIVNIVQEGLVKGVDISQRLRDLDLEEKEGALETSKTYVSAKASDPDSF